MPLAKMACADARFSNADKGARDYEKQKTAGEAARQCSQAPANNSESNDGFAAETVSEQSKRNTSGGENDKQPGLQGAELLVRNSEADAQHGNQRDENPARGKVDKVDQNKYSKKAKLIGRERNGFR